MTQDSRSTRLCHSKIISIALLEIVNNVNLNKPGPFNHKSNAHIKKIGKCKNLDFDEHFQFFMLI